MTVDGISILEAVEISGGVGAVVSWDPGDIYMDMRSAPWSTAQQCLKLEECISSERRGSAPSSTSDHFKDVSSEPIIFLLSRPFGMRRCRVLSFPSTRSTNSAHSNHKLLEKSCIFSFNNTFLGTLTCGLALRHSPLEFIRSILLVFSVLREIDFVSFYLTNKFTFSLTPMAQVRSATTLDANKKPLYDLSRCESLGLGMRCIA